MEVITMQPYYERSYLIWNAQISPDQKLFLLALSEYLGADDSCWPSYQTISEMTGFSQKRIIRLIEGMEHLGLITKQIQENYLTRETCVFYFVNWLALSSNGKS